MTKRGILQGAPVWVGAAFVATMLAAWGKTTTAEAQIQRISVADDNSQANADSYEARISDDGGVVAFRSSATNLVAVDTNGWSDIFVRDLGAGTTEMVSLAPDGSQLGNGLNHRPSLSDDGLLVLFSARYPVGGATTIPVLRDRTVGTSEFLFENRGSNGAAIRPSQGILNAEISGNGQFVAFDSKSQLQGLFEPDIQPTNDDFNLAFDVFFHDIVTEPPPQIERLSANPSGLPGNGDSIQARISGDGQVVAFRSRASDLVPSDTNQRWDVFVRDRTTNPATTQRVSVSSDGTEANHYSTDPDVSDDGRFVVFRSLASNLVPDDTNNRADVFVHDRTTGETAIVSRPAAGESNGTSHAPAISGDGAWIVFESDATNLVAADTNGARDIFRAPNPLFSTRGGQ